jgi:hypothetical protein
MPLRTATLRLPSFPATTKESSARMAGGIATPASPAPGMRGNRS